MLEEESRVVSLCVFVILTALVLVVFAKHDLLCWKLTALCSAGCSAHFELVQHPQLESELIFELGLLSPVRVQSLSPSSARIFA